MKNIIALTALAAAASAQTAPASGLNYNQIGFSRTQRANTITAQGLLGATNFLVGINSSNLNAGGDNNQNSEPSVTVGYVFKGLTNGIDATVYATQPQWEETVYGVTLRRALNEVYQGLEISAGYVGTFSSGHGSYFVAGGVSNWGESATNVELSYNINKTFSVAVGLVKFKESGSDSRSETVYSVRAGF